MIYSRVTPFWSGTLEIRKMFYLILIKLSMLPVCSYFAGYHTTLPVADESVHGGRSECDSGSADGTPGLQPPHFRYVLGLFLLFQSLLSPLTVRFLCLLLSHLDCNLLSSGMSWISSFLSGLPPSPFTVRFLCLLLSHLDCNLFSSGMCWISSYLSSLSLLHLLSGFFVYSVHTWTATSSLQVCLGSLSTLAVSPLLHLLSGFFVCCVHTWTATCSIQVCLGSLSTCPHSPPSPSGFFVCVRQLYCWGIIVCITVVTF